MFKAVGVSGSVILLQRFGFWAYDRGLDSGLGIRGMVFW
jgi:hypothetical protein